MEQVFADLCRQLPLAYVFCALRFANESFCAMVENDDDLWRERRRALLSFVSPSMYPPELVKEGFISIEEQEVVEQETIQQEGNPQENEPTLPLSSQPPPKVTLLVQGKDREICEMFIKNATQRWAIEHVMRSWRLQFLAQSASMEHFWHQKANAREDMDIYGTPSNDPIVNNRQIDVNEMHQLAASARRSVATRIQGDAADRLYEQNLRK